MDNKRLAIISDCVHFKTPDGRVATENHIFLKQMEALSAHFSHTIICCPFEDFSGDKIYTGYCADIEFYPTPNVGGDAISDKFAIVKAIPVWRKIFKKLYKQSDYFYLRFPNNLNIPGFFYFNFKNKPLFASYTGTWKNYAGEPATYRFQKYLLKHFFKGPVFAYIENNEPKYKLYKTFSPSYKKEIWEEEKENVEIKFFQLKMRKIVKPVFISIGALNENKNQLFILHAMKILHEKNVDFIFYLVGDGPLKKHFENFIQENNLQEKIFLTGKLTSESLRSYYRQSNFIIQASLVEGYGKVPVEGYFHGVIPFLNNTPMVKEILGGGKCGFSFDAKNYLEFADFLIEKIQAPELLAEKLMAGRAYSKTLTLQNWSSEILETIQKFYANQS